MSLHSYQWPTSPHNPVKPAVRNCAFQLAWHKFQDHHHISSADRRSHYEDVLRAKYVERKSVAEIASETNSTEKAVESLLTRARDAFRESYGADE